MSILIGQKWCEMPKFKNWRKMPKLKIICDIFSNFQSLCFSVFVKICLSKKSWDEKIEIRDNNKICEMEKNSRKMWNCLKATIWYFFGIYDAIKAFSCQLFVIADVTCLLWFHAEKSRFKNLPGFRAAHAASSWWAEHKIQNYRSWIEVLPDFPDPHHKSFRRKTEQKQFVA